LRALAAKLQMVEEAERKKLAQELHDRVGQNLTGLSINLGIIRSRLLPECMERVESRIADCVGLVGNTMECIRDVMAELHPPGLTEYGLSAALKCYCDQLSKRTGLRVLMETTEPVFLPRRESEMALFRIAQEALTNAVRHSKAREVTISLQSVEEKLVLSIADDGAGFDVDAPAALAEGGRFGLINMRERAEALGGELLVESAAGKGPKVTVALMQVRS
jgi:two-component system sensor histidine kinase UhpB